MDTFFKVFKQALPNAPVNQIYNIGLKLETDIWPGYAMNFDTDAFLKRNVTSDGEIKLAKGLWIFDVALECDIVMTNGTNLAETHEIFAIDFGIQAYLNKVISNDRTKFLYTGYKDGMCNYRFAISNQVDNALFKVEFTPTCKKRAATSVGTSLVNMTSVSIMIKNFSLSGSRLHDYGNLPLVKNIEEKEGDKIVKKSQTSTPQ